MMFAELSFHLVLAISLCKVHPYNHLADSTVLISCDQPQYKNAALIHRRSSTSNIYHRLNEQVSSGHFAGYRSFIPGTLSECCASVDTMR